MHHGQVTKECHANLIDWHLQYTVVAFLVFLSYMM